METQKPFKGSAEPDQAAVLLSIARSGLRLGSARFRWTPGLHVLVSLFVAQGQWQTRRWDAKNQSIARAIAHLLEQPELQQGRTIFDKPRGVGQVPEGSRLATHLL